MKRLSHEARAKRRETIRAEIAAGLSKTEAARKYGLTYHYVASIASGLVAPTARKTGLERRRAQAQELVSLGFTRKQVAKRLGITVNRLSYYGIKAPYDRTGEWAAIIEKSRDRAALMAALYTDGRTLADIGAQFGITYERVRQLIKKHFRMTGEHGGKSTMARRRAEQTKAKKDAAALAKHGCTYDQYRALPRKAKYAFQQQRRNAKDRGIAWEFNLWQWWSVWEASGHWEQRGRGQGYMMCRNGDTGPYAPWNIHIAPGTQNSSEGQARRKLDPSLPIGVKRTKAGRYRAHRILNGERLYLGTHDTPDLAYAAYLRAAVTAGVAA